MLLEKKSAVFLCTSSYASKLTSKSKWYKFKVFAWSAFCWNMGWVKPDKSHS